jgi:SAM-dependent methyltransferase
MPRYDGLAGEYDAHYQRNVDRWEDERLAYLLEPFVNNKDVLDLGCGTGWVLDHLAPASYCGVDASLEMLEVLRAKHSGVVTEARWVGMPDWTDGLPMVDTVVATWAADYFDLEAVLTDVRPLVRPGGAICFHGNHMRGRRRKHCIDRRTVDDISWRPENVKQSAQLAGLPPNAAYGTGMMPDALAGNRWLWHLALLLPWRWHFAALHVWEP